MILRTTLTSGQVLAARYELVRALATGHDQATWLARDLRAACDVVLRVRSASDAGAPRPTVHHPALQAPQAMLRDGDIAFDVFDYLPGGEIGRLRGRHCMRRAGRTATSSRRTCCLTRRAWRG
jgi:hypothetical protein